jgi:hypothetical protein
MHDRCTRSPADLVRATDRREDEPLAIARSADRGTRSIGKSSLIGVSRRPHGHRIRSSSMGQDDGRRYPMGPRFMTFLVAVALTVFGLGGTSLADADRADAEIVFGRDEDAGGVLATEGDDGDDTTDGGDGGDDSDDGTNSRVTSASRADDRSRGDLTRDWTKDGPGTSTRDRSAGHTNDGSRHDTR